MSKAYYAVAIGREAGIYATWGECQAQTSGFSGARFKKFSTKADAEQFIKLEGKGQKNVSHGQEEKERKEISIISKHPPSFLGFIYLLRFDGGADADRGRGGCGAVLYFVERDAEQDETLKEIWHGYKSFASATNNFAEYQGLILGMRVATEYKIDSLLVQGDSQLVISQMTGVYSVKEATLKLLHQEAKMLASQIPKIAYQHIYRDQNSVADSLATQGKRAELG